MQFTTFQSVYASCFVYCVHSQSPHDEQHMAVFLLSLHFKDNTVCVIEHISFNSVTVTNFYLLCIVPVPTTVMLSTSIPSPIRPIGATFDLICTVLLTSRPAIDIPLNVNFELLRTHPAGSPALTTTAPSMSRSNYTTIAIISSFGRNDSGVYTCRATVSSASVNTYVSDSNAQSHSINVTTGELYHYHSLYDKYYHGCLHNYSRVYIYTN